jgi:hypothetical protein
MQNELAGSLPIWKFYGWSNMFIERLDKYLLRPILV